MKIIQIIVIIFMLAHVNCRQSPGKNKSKGNLMLQDSSYANDRDVSIVKEKGVIRLDESKSLFEDYPNIMQTDIDAAGKTPNPGIQYVKAGDTLKFTEPQAKIY